MTRRLALALAAPLLALAACAPAQPFATAPPVAPVACDTRFDVVNNTNLAVRELYFSPSSQGAWGPDRLGTSVIVAGASMRFLAAQEGAHDFRAVMANGRAFELYRIDVCTASRITVTAGGLRAS